MSATNPCQFKPLRSPVGEDAKGRKIETETRATACIDEDGDREIDIWTENVFRLVNGKRDPKAPVEQRSCTTWGGCRVLTTPPPAKSKIPEVAPVKPKKASLDSKTVFIARVLFAETVGQTSAERRLVASVMHNRIGHDGFGGGQLKDAFQVAKQPLAFSCVRDKDNKQWRLSATPDKMDADTKKIWDDCVALAKELMTGKFKPVNDDIVYYHDNSRTRPPHWDNDWFTTRLVESDSTAFKFYSVRRTVGLMEAVDGLFSKK